MIRAAAFSRDQVIARAWNRVGAGFLPFAEVASPELPWGRLLRLSLFQVSVGMAAALVIGTLNRVMIVELGVPAWLVSVMVALPLVFAPMRAVIGFRSDTHRSLLGWRRVPFLWMGTLLQFGGFAIMPFALLVLSEGTRAPPFVGAAAAGLAFLLVGAGLHTTQTVGLALATDLAPPRARPRVVTLLCVMLLVGMFGSALIFGALLARFSEFRLIQVIQGAALTTLALNAVALWKQEARDPSRTSPAVVRPSLRACWRLLAGQHRARRRLVAVGLGTVAFSMQDILLEPYGGQVLHLSVGATTSLTALLAAGGVCGFGLAAWCLAREADRYRLAAIGVLVGLVAFAAVLFAAPLGSKPLFGAGILLVGAGAALFLVGTLTAAMDFAAPASAAEAQGVQAGLSLGTWGAVQAFAAGAAIAAGGLLRDGVAGLAASGALGNTLATPFTGYGAVYALEIALLFATLIALGPLAQFRGAPRGAPSRCL